MENFLLFGLWRPHGPPTILGDWTPQGTRRLMVNRFYVSILWDDFLMRTFCTSCFVRSWSTVVWVVHLVFYEIGPPFYVPENISKCDIYL